MSRKKVVMLLMTKRFDDLTEERKYFRAVVDQMEAADFEVELTWALGKSEDFIIEQLRNADVAWCAGNPPMTRKVIEALPNLKLIQRSGIGLNSIDLQAATDCGVVVHGLTGYCIEELATHSVAFILACMRSLTSFDRRIRAGEWPKGKAPMPLRLRNLTAGAYGLGGSGRYLVEMLKNGFGCTMIACDPYADPKAAEGLGVELVSFDEFLERSDIISIHAPLTPETYHVFNEEAFAKMKPNVIIANTSRGPIIDQNALIAALENKQIMGAGIDVFEEEPIEADNRLKELDNVILTPHSAYMGKEAKEMQDYLSSCLPGLMLHQNTVCTKYVANPDVLKKLPELKVVSEI